MTAKQLRCKHQRSAACKALPRSRMTESARVASWNCRAKPKTRREVRGGGRLRYRICRNSGPHFNIIGRVLRFWEQHSAPKRCLHRSKRVFNVIHSVFRYFSYAAGLDPLERPTGASHTFCRSRFAHLFGRAQLVQLMLMMGAPRASIMSISCSPSSLASPPFQHHREFPRGYKLET